MAPIEAYADPITGEIRTSQQIKQESAEAARRLVDSMFQEVAEDFGLSEIPALKATEKVVKAILDTVVAERVREQIDSYKPKQMELGLDDE